MARASSLLACANRCSNWVSSRGKRHTALGAPALHDSPGGRKVGEGRTLTHRQESLLRALFLDNTPDDLTMPEALWTRRAVGQLINQRLGIQLPVRTLDSYLARRGFIPHRQLNRKDKAVSAALKPWTIKGYPGIAAQSKAQGGGINWGNQHGVLVDGDPWAGGGQPTWHAS